ncbi:polyprenyl synthetase family protein [Marinospirillum sp.]|uniref:polyprenyl synthetase family protein n=1 Tax=Marinospirillum sp. TaxID=2183934 RepID=UPI0028703D99|nr:polyprenyl synthetase family protein [Marinospirillum sp.]MDR9466811.1 polyprenyl synthetase family protein [Marinospirillum sp.]
MSASSSSIHAVVADDFDAVNQLIIRECASQVPLVEKIAHHIIDSGGKRLRPLLVLLVSRALSCQGEKHLLLAALIEFMHTSTLLHDDVVDESSLRRGKPTANSQWSNQSCVLVGDFLYSRSFEMMVRIGSMEIMEILAKVTCVLAEGEVMQLTNVRNPKISEEQYMQVIHAKTAKLFEGATQAAALLSGASPEQQLAMRDYGKNLGMAFQLVDDLLDYEGDAATMGKNVGDDLAEGKPTLPLIYAMQQGTDEEAKLIRRAIRKGGLDQLDQVLDIVNKTGALDYTRDQAAACSEAAKHCLEVLPASEFKETLYLLTDLALGRKS